MDTARHWGMLAVVSIIAFLWIVIHHAGTEFGVLLGAFLPGLAVFAAAFLLSWGAELAQIELPTSLAFAFLALIAVLPEYAVDIYFAWVAAKEPEYIQYAAANMTGANRLLIGMGWPVILFAYWLKSRKKEIVLEESHKLEIGALFIATMYSFVIPLKGTLSLMDAIILLLIFGVYIYKTTRAHILEPELEGITEIIGEWKSLHRRVMTILFFVLSGYTIFTAAEPFAEGLLKLGRHLDIDEFILVQWLAPLASESPEFIVAVIFVLRFNPSGGFHTLISSKINQWTLLVGMLPVAYILSLGYNDVMQLDFRQREEIFLTGAQSLFAVLLLCNFRFSIWEGLALFVLFSTQLFFISSTMRLIYAIAYIALSLVILAFFAGKRSGIFSLFRR